MQAEKNSITESRPKPVKAMEEAMMPTVMATPASTVIQAMLAYSSQNPRRRSRDTSAGGKLIRSPGDRQRRTTAEVRPGNA